MQRSALCRSRRELSNAYFIANFRFDTAENESCEVCCIPHRCLPAPPLPAGIGLGAIGASGAIVVVLAYPLIALIALIELLIWPVAVCSPRQNSTLLPEKTISRKK